MEYSRKNNGITLIVLVVTIVIMLILAGVSINLVLGPNGLISKTKETVIKANEVTKEEEQIRNSYVDMINKYTENNEESNSSVEVPIEHNLKKIETKEATCTENGNIAYWYCEHCNKYFSDEGAITEIQLADTVIPKLSHNLEKIEAKEATCTEDGNIAYWQCRSCGKYFSNAGGTTEISLAKTVIPARGHNFVNGICKVCGQRE